MSTPRIIVLEPEPFRSTFPEVLETYVASRESANIVHDLIGGGVAVALLRAAPRSGILSLYYSDRVTAYTAFNLLSERLTFSLSEDYLNPGTQPGDMQFAVVGRGVSIRLDGETGTHWIVEAEFQELDNT